ncbi:ABC transporter ATP-binding protein [Tellurirhabdus bombi]|uniref:ABC transporter ATP-binding protein n=1 Tax=Tellurirhabdus bombi TaxID=2907205 RepID=UPI001F1BC61D|nr:ATP-binding cassette domain-containing protein [Tellurirhabdus bombi]
MLTIRQFRKAYNDQPILIIPELNFTPGLHWLKGQNGSGKTTLFRSIAGLLPHEGEMILNTQYNSRKNPVEYRLRVNYSEAEPLYPEFLTAWELIRWVGKTKRAPAGQMENLIQVFGIQSFLLNPVGTYSSGMLKKTSLILAFLGQPQLILLDEPFVTLDEATVQRVINLIRAEREKGTSFLLSTHQDVNFSGLIVDSIWHIQHQTISPLLNEQPTDRSK